MAESNAFNRWLRTEARRRRGVVQNVPPPGAPEPTADPPAPGAEEHADEGRRLAAAVNAAIRRAAGRR